MKVGLKWQKMSEHLSVTNSRVEDYLFFDLIFPASMTVPSMK